MFKSAERAEDELAEIVRTGEQISPRRYRRLIRQARIQTTHALLKQNGREIGRIRAAIDYVDDVPVALLREEKNR
jgi:hypothetical protein